VTRRQSPAPASIRLGPPRRRRVVLSLAALAGVWLSAAGALFFATVILEMVAWQPLHRGEFERAEPLLEVGTALSRASTWIRVPGQRLRLAAYLGNLAEAREDRDPVKAERLYRESIAILEDELGPDDSQVRFARWRYASFRHSTGRAGAGDAP